MALIPSFTVTAPPRQNIQNNHKRSSSPASLDCHSLQSSLKRIRLSCSPGELRLQRDLSALGHFGWQPQQDSISLSTATNNRGGDFPSHPPRWRKANAELVFLDPLRLKLTYVDVDSAATTANDMNNDETAWSTTGSNTTTSSSTSISSTTTMWIQIPRMYPHRPPVISRADHSPFLLVVRDSPLGSVKDDPLGPPTNHDPSVREQRVPPSTAVMDWSPVRQISDLLSFILEQLSIFSLQTPFSASTRFLENTTAAARPSCSKTTAVSFSMNIPKTSSSNSCSIQPQQQRHQRSSSLDLFILDDEQKMDDVAMGVDDSSTGAGAGETSQEASSAAAEERCLLAPNRFDMGYGRYHDILATSSSSSSLQSLKQRPQQQQQQQQSQREDPCAMEI